MTKNWTLKQVDECQKMFEKANYFLKYLSGYERVEKKAEFS